MAPLFRKASAKRRLAPCLCLALALAAVLPGECAGDPLSDLDSLILDNQRKLNREGDQGRGSGQSPERRRNGVDAPPRPPSRSGSSPPAGGCGTLPVTLKRVLRPRLDLRSVTVVTLLHVPVFR